MYTPQSPYQQTAQTQAHDPLVSGLGDMVSSAGFGGLLDGGANGSYSKTYSSSSSSGSTTTYHSSSSSSGSSSSSSWGWPSGSSSSTDSFDLKHIFNNHDHGGDAGMGGKHDYAHNMGNPMDPLDHWPAHKPEDKNK